MSWITASTASLPAKTTACQSTSTSRTRLSLVKGRLGVFALRDVAGDRQNTRRISVLFENRAAYFQLDRGSVLGQDLDLEVGGLFRFPFPAQSPARPFETLGPDQIGEILPDQFLL